MALSYGSGSKIVSLLTRRGEPDISCFTEVEAYWNALCDGRIMPSRSEVDPRGIAGSLDKVFLLERVAPGVARFRLAGSSLADLMGMDVRGMPLTCFFMPGARRDIADACEAVFGDPARVELGLSGPGRIGQKAACARMLLLPLRDNDGAVTRAIGCLTSTQVGKHTPQRYDVTSDTRQTLIGYGAVRPDSRTAPGTPANVIRTDVEDVPPGLPAVIDTPPASGIVPPEQGRPRRPSRPHLTIVN